VAGLEGETYIKLFGKMSYTAGLYINGNRIPADGLCRGTGLCGKATKKRKRAGGAESGIAA